MLRSGQTATELSGDKKILIAGGENAQHQPSLQIATFNPARIWTDKDDYLPGDNVVLSGSGWKPNENVYLYAVDDTTEAWTYGSTETADATGAFVVNPYFVVQLVQLGANFSVSAVGAQSALQADVKFTDAPRIGAVTVGSQTGTLTYGTAGSATFSVTTARTGNGTVNGTFSVIGLPAGATATFVPPTFTAMGNNAFPNATLTVSTTASAPAGTYSITVHCDDGNDHSTSGAGTLTIGPKHITGSFTAQGKQYDGNNSATVLTRNLSGVVGADAVQLTGGTATFSDKNVGNGKTVTLTGATLTGAAANNYVLDSVSTTTANITAKHITGSFTAQNKQYDGDTSATVLTRSLNGVISPDVITLAAGTATFSDKNVGNGKTVTLTGASLSGADAGNYVLDSVSTTTANITKADATVVVTPYTVTYDGQSHTATVTSITGVNGETGATVGTVDVSGTTHVMANTYNDTWSFTGTANYNNIAATSITDTINKKAVTWTTNPNSKTYGDADPNPLTTGSGSGFAASDTVTATYTRAAGETVAGGPYHITATLGPADVVANYNITNDGANFTISPKNATWTTNPNSKTYGDADPNPLTTGSGSGFLAGDNVTATYSRAAGETVTSGPYHITATLAPTGVLSNYNITNAGADFTINAKNATWTTNPNSKTYGDTDPNPLTTGSGSGFLAGDNVTATYSRVAGETVLGGPYHITATLSPAAVLTNYSITNAGAAFTINTRPATWTTNPASKTYGNADPVPLTTGSGDFLAADGVTASYSRDSGETVLGGPYHITATLSPAAVLTNYSITNAGAAFTINTRPATWTTNPNSKTYGNADPNPLTTGSGDFLAADNVTATYSRVAGETVLGGPYHITATLSPAAVLTNYSITNAGAAFTINTRPATWTTNPASKTYGNADPVPLTTGSGDFLAADGVTASYSRDAGETVLGGPYHITATLSPAAVLRTTASPTLVQSSRSTHVRRHGRPIRRARPTGMQIRFR